MKAAFIAAAACTAVFISSCADTASSSQPYTSAAEKTVSDTVQQTTITSDISEYAFTDNELMHDTVWKTYTDRGTYDIPQLTFEGGDKVRYEASDFIIEGTAKYPATDSTEGVLLFGKCTYTFQLQPTSPRGIALTFVSGDDILPQKCLFLT